MRRALELGARAEGRTRPNPAVGAVVVAGQQIVGEGYQEKGVVNYTHGGGRIEHWVSKDKGNTWKLHRDITPGAAKYPGWSFNNVQPVVRPDGSIVDGMLIFYGWLDETKPEAVAFLLDESTQIT